MIKNDRQLSRARERISEIRNQILDITNRYEGMERYIFTSPLLNEIAELEAEIAEYEGLVKETLAGAVRERLKRPTLLDNIGQLLAKLRIAAGLTQTELAEQLGWQQSNMSRFENENYSSQTVAKIVEYADSLGVWLYVVPELAELPEDVRYKQVTDINVQTVMIPIEYGKQEGNWTTDTEFKLTPFKQQSKTKNFDLTGKPEYTPL